MALKIKFVLTLIIVTGTSLRVLSNQQEPLVINLKAIPGLQYDLPRFAVKPGAKVRLTLTNTDDMSHNLLFTKPGARQAVVDAALKMGDNAPDFNYIPSVAEVLWSIPVLSPGESKTITFSAPSTPGVYPYVCTYPGHGFVMYGAMYVTQEGLPPLEDDLNIPPNLRTATGNHIQHAGHDQKPGHPYEQVPPYLYRTFTHESGPATIAVRLPGNLSYFWDAATCRLRMATRGGFVDMKSLWAGHRQATAKILGKVFYSDTAEYPIRMGAGDDRPRVRFKGYRLVEHYPEFHYIINGIDVYELIKEKADGQGLIRSFRIPHAKGQVWFALAGEGVFYTVSAGSRIDGKLMLTASQAKQFTITMTVKDEKPL